MHFSRRPLVFVVRALASLSIVHGAVACSVSRDEVAPGSLDSTRLSSRSGWTASASPTGEGPSRAIDGDLGTRWSTGRGMRPGDYFQLDLDACYEVNRVVMDSGSSVGDQARGYEIYVSNDGVTWGSTASVGVGTTQRVDASFSPVAGSHVKIVQTGSSGSWWSLHELEIYGAKCGHEPTPEIPRDRWTNASAISSSDEDDVRHAFDGDPSTRWSTGHPMRDGDWFQVNLGDCFDLDRIIMDSARSPNDYARGYQVFVSNDGVSWGSPAAAAAATGTPVDVSFPARTGRWLRIVQTGSSDAWWWSLHELHAFGRASSACGSAQPPPVVPPTATARLRVATWNVRYGTNRWESFAVPAQIELMKALDADVVMLQESEHDDAYLQGLRSVRSTWTRAGGTMPIFSRLPIAGGENRYIGRNSWGDSGRWATRADVLVGEKAVSIFNTHLDIAPNPCGSTAYHVDNRDAFLAFTRETSGPKVLGGDLNAWSWSPEGCDYQRDTLSGFAAYYANACTDVGRSESECNEYVTFHNENGVRWRPDHLYRNAAVRFLSYTVQDSSLSDHKPVIVDIEVP
jgi:endonuclease/exonuclease/phosphatase (EEP) superfamily protein YafD